MFRTHGFQWIHRSNHVRKNALVRRLGTMVASLVIFCMLAPSLPALAHASVDAQWSSVLPPAPRTLAQASVAQAGNPASPLRIEPMVAYNFIVDSNVETPATYAPTSAMLALHVCNDGGTPLTNVQAMIGNFDPSNSSNSTPGLYPARTNPPTGQIGTFSLVHEGGSAGLADATRYVGDLAAGACVTQYWLVSYPRLDANGDSVNRGIKPFDDLWLEYDFWATAQNGATPLTADITRRVYMRNEISAMANKIWPNTTSKVPNEYLAAIPDPLGWSTQAEDGSAVGTPGGIVTTKGVWFDLGNIGAGFDNDGDLVPDRNAWLQPVGDPALFDAGCFRLVKAHGLLIIKLNDGTKQLIEFEDQLYFEHIPGNNTGGVGIVQYDFAVLDGNCSAAASPYQEVASGYDNEKFNFDFGQQPPPLTSAAPTVLLSKSAEPARVAPGQALTYTMAFTNTSAQAVGQKRFGLPLVISDTIPAGTTYVAGSATSRNTPPSGRTYVLRYSTNHGQTWSLTEPSPATNTTTLQWWLSDTLPGNGAGRVGYSVQVSSAYTLPAVPNVATASFGGAVPFAESKTQTPVTGINSLTGIVFADMGANRSNGAKESDESGIPAVSLTLGVDLDNDGDVDVEGGTLDTNASGVYTFTDLMDGAYIVTVNVLDTALAGYAPTTPITRAVALDAARTNPSPVVVSNVNFGFASALTLDKTLVNSGEIYPGQQITFTIAANAVSDSSACITTTWAITNYSLNVQFFANFDRAFGAGGPDGRYATANSANPPLLVSAHYFPLAALPGNITKVEALYSVVLTGTITDDTVEVRLYDGFNSQIGSSTFTAAGLNPFSGFPANQGLLVWDVTNLAGVPWSAAFISDTVVSEIEFLKNGGASDAATLNLDAVGIRVTTNQSCTSLNPVALQDTYDAGQLEFVTATPSVSSATPAGTLTWNNIGPLTPGTPLTVTTVFRAREAAAGSSTLNQAAVSFVLTGSTVVTLTDSAPVTVSRPGVIGDTIFWDTNANGLQDWYEAGIPSVVVSLYRDSNGNGAYEAGTDVLARSDTTGIDGRYLFTDVIPSDYFVIVGAISANPILAADPDADGIPCPGSGLAACDGRDFVELSAGMIYHGADFGYLPSGSAFGDTVWIDLNANGVRDEFEPGLPFVTVQLSNGVTTSTDLNGYYRFTNVADGTYNVTVDASDPDLPAGLTAVKDPDATPNGQTSVVLAGGQIVQLGGTACSACNLYVDFGYRLTGILDLSGTVCLDDTQVQNGICGVGASGVLTTESAVRPVAVVLSRWVDADSDTLPESEELVTAAVTTTNDSGDYAFTGLPAATYIASSLAPMERVTATTLSGYNARVLRVEKQTSPGVTHSMYQVITATASVTNVDFAYIVLDVYDFGDLPAPYQTRREQVPSGPYHTVAPSNPLRIGANVGSEAAGKPSVLADGDTFDDGVTVPAGQVWSSSGGVVRVEVSGSGHLYGWIDFNLDGDFIDSGEAIISQTVSAGSANYNFAMPGNVFGTGRVALPARFRLFEQRPKWPQFAANDRGISSGVAAGEVEDYLYTAGLSIDMDTTTPTAVSGGQVTYVVSVVNTGTLPLSGVAITSVLPSSFTYAQSTISAANATRTASTDPLVNAAVPVWGTWTITPGGSVVITQVVAVSTTVPPGTYDSTSATSSTQTGPVDDDGVAAQDPGTPPGLDPETDEDVTITACSTIIRGQVCRDDDGNRLCDGSNQPLANVPVTLRPEGTTPGNILMQVTDANGMVEFDAGRDGFAVPGDYLLQVQDAKLNGVDGLYPTQSSLAFFSIAACQAVERQYGYALSARGAVGDLVWYDVNNNGLQDEWYDANGDGLITKNIPDANGAIDYSLFEWYDSNGNNTYDRPEDVAELRRCGIFSATLTLNGGAANTISGILGYYRFRPSDLNRTHSVALDPNDPALLSGAQAIHATGLCKPYATTTAVAAATVPQVTPQNTTSVACSPSTGTAQTSKVLTAGPPVSNSQDLGLDFGLSCRTISLNVTATPLCITEVPYLQYTVAPVNFTPGSNPVKIRWLDVDDDSELYVYANQPLSQTMLWPEAATDESGRGIAWPGWSVVNGEWLYTGSNVRPQVKLTFEVNPTYTVTVSYPQPQPTCVSEPSAAVGDLVWLDTNMNGLQDTGENGRANVPVNLLDSSMAVITSTLSDSSGRYRFKLPGAGVYYLEAFAPAGYLFSQQNQGSDDQKDSDASEIGIIGPITVTNNTWDLSLDFGLFDDSVNVSLGDYIWADENLNGVQDSGEPGLPGVLVNLYRDVNDNGILDDGDTYLRSRVTDATGFYRFASLPTDDYLVHVDASNFLPGAALEDYTNTPGMEDPDDYNDTDDNGVLVTNLTGGYASKAATVLPWTAAVPDKSFGVLAIQIRNPTIDFGFHEKLAKIGDLVWLDVNKNAQQDPGEPGVPGVTVALYHASGTLITTTLSDGQGQFVFDKLPADTYVLGFTPPPPFQFTTPNTGDDPSDSDVDPATGRTQPATLTPGDTLVTVDAGLTLDIEPGNLGDRIWYDANQNGVQDTSESGVGGVTVRLYREGVFLAQTASNSDGAYAFESLVPGNYQIEIAPAGGYQLTQIDQGSDDNQDSDIGGTTGRSAVIPLAAGQTNRSVDAGLILPAAGQPGSLLVNTWYDLALNGVWDADEVGVPGLTVILYNGSGAPVGTATSNGNGQVFFPNLVPGTYYVGTPSLGGYLPTVIVQGEPTKVSDLNPDLLVTSPVTVTSSGAQQTIGVWSSTPGTTKPLAVLKPAQLGNLVWNDRNGDGLQEGSEPGIRGVAVRLYTVARELLSTDVTDANGTYLFPNLLPGQYYISFVIPQNNQAQFSPQNTGSTGSIDSDADRATGYTVLITLAAEMTNLDVDAGLSGVPTDLPVTEEPNTSTNRIYLPVITTQQ